MNKILLLIAILAVSLHISAQTYEVVQDSIDKDSVLTWPEKLRVDIEQLMTDRLLRTSHVGMCIYDITADSVLYEHDSQKLMRPASTMKLLTSITALSKLGGGHTFDTRLFRTGEVVDSILNGNLYIVGNFDPKFSNDDLHAMVDKITSLGIKQVEGGIFADMSMKDTLKLGEGWCWDDDNPQLIPLQLNQKNVVLKELRKKLKDEGIEVDTIGLALCPTDSATLMIRRFHTIDQVLMRMMKRSSNLYAEAMFYQLPNAGKHGLFSSAKDAAKVIQSLIRELGFDASAYTIADGSGLSIYNQLSPELEVAFLRYAYANTNIFNHLYPSLPIAGVDGTLSNRMTSGLAENNVHAKTGTLRSVSSLAGYATAKNGHFICFSIINQGGIISQQTARRWQDKVCQAICD